MAPQDPPKTDFTIDAGMVKHVAFLVRLGIQEEEAQAFSHQFTSIIDYFHLLNEVDTQNVPHSDGAFVQVPLVFGEE